MSRNDSHQAPALCVWTEAGIGYKLCDLDFRCEQCPFDLQMRESFAEKREMGNPHVRPNSESPPEIHARQTGEQILDSFFTLLGRPSFPPDRTYHRRHQWIQGRGYSGVRIGLDHVATTMLGSIASIVIPEPGTRLIEDMPWCWLIHDDGAISLSAPLQGTVIEPNTELLDHPEYLIQDPYDRGWIARVRQRAAPQNDVHLVPSKEHATQVESELCDLRNQFRQHLKKRPHLGTTLYDGGHPIETLSAMVGTRTFFAIISSLFSE